VSSSSSSSSTEDESDKLETPKRTRETPDRAAKRKAVAASNKKASTAKKKGKASNKRKIPSSTKGKKKRTLETIKEEAVDLLYKTTRSVPNYTVEEDVLLCKAWVSCSTDETKGKDRKGTAFWNDVKEKFDQLAAQEDND
jgi:hypothetical protein